MNKTHSNKLSGTHTKKGHFLHKVKEFELTITIIK